MINIPGTRQSVAGPISGVAHRPNLADSIRTASNQTDSSTSTTSSGASIISTTARASADKPIASGNGINVSIDMAEPVLFLQGYEQNDTSNRSTAMLRGRLHLHVAKSAKIKAVTLKFKGRAVTKWPEGIPPKKQDTEEVNSIMSHTWPFFNAQFPTAEAGPGADQVALASAAPNADLTSAASKNRASFDIRAIRSSSPAASNLNLSSAEAKRLSLQ
ncbi:hypothetical protein LTS18_013337, partial [Coniosporium uncinatum]